MATITKTSLAGSGSRLVTVTTLSASDTFTYADGDVLHINNVTAGALTINLDGDGSTTIPVKGYGSIDVSGGYDVPSLAAGATAIIPLDTVAAYLKGTVTVTGGDAAEAYIVSQ